MFLYFHKKERKKKTTSNHFQLLTYIFNTKVALQKMIQDEWFLLKNVLEKQPLPVKKQGKHGCVTRAHTFLWVDTLSFFPSLQWNNGRDQHHSNEMKWKWLLYSYVYKYFLNAYAKKSKVHMFGIMQIFRGESVLSTGAHRNICAFLCAFMDLYVQTYQHSFFSSIFILYSSFIVPSGKLKRNFLLTLTIK